MVLVTLIPLVNLLSVMVLTRFAGSAGVGYRQMIKPIITNPLIIACVLGAALNFSGLGLPF